MGTSNPARSLLGQKADEVKDMMLYYFDLLRMMASFLFDKSWHTFNYIKLGSDTLDFPYMERFFKQEATPDGKSIAVQTDIRKWANKNLEQGYVDSMQNRIQEVHSKYFKFGKGLVGRGAAMKAVKNEDWKIPLLG